MTKSDAAKEDLAFQRNMMSSFIQIGALAVLLGFSLSIIGPFAGIVVWGIILAVAIYPLHLGLAARLRGRPKWSAVVITIISLVILLLPGWVVTQSSIETATHVAAEIRQGSLEIPPPSERVAGWPLIGKPVYKAWSAGATNLDEFLQTYRPQVKATGEWLLHAAGGLALGLAHFTASLLVAGVLLLYASHGYGLSCAVGDRIAPNRGAQLTDLCVSTIRSVTNGVLGVAVIQAILAGIGFSLIGVPAAGFLTVVILVTAIVQIPAILIIAPVIVWVYSFADPVPATIFAVYSVAVALSDNVLKPLLLGRGVDLPVLVVLIGAIGGMIRFGVIGLFIGAVILGLAYQIITAWVWPPQPAAPAAND